MSNVLGLVVGFGISGVCGKPLGEEDDGRIWIQYYVLFILDFLCVIWECTVPRFNIDPSSLRKKLSTTSVISC
jgi:hypothetical protein